MVRMDIHDKERERLGWRQVELLFQTHYGKGDRILDYGSGDLDSNPSVPFKAF